MLETATTGFATIGRVYSYVGVFMAILIGIIFFAIAIYLLLHSNRNNVTLSANVSDATCTTIPPSKPNYPPGISCNANVAYEYDKKKYNDNVSTNYTVKKDDKINVSIDPIVPNKASTMTLNTDWIAGFLIVIALLVIIFSFIRLYIVRQSPESAAMFGALDVTGMAVNQFRRY